MTDPLPDCIELGPANATRAVIWLHGLGADGNDFVPIIPELKLPAAASIRFVFPNADIRPVTINGGYKMRAWYDILEAGNLSRRLDEASIVQSVKQITGLIKREIKRGIASDHIVLAGFSQGGLVALCAGMAFDQPLAGILALSTYWPEFSDPALQPATVNRATPIFCAHGEFDGMITLSLGKAAHTRLQAMGCNAQWHQYMMEHEVCREEIRDIGQWLGTVLKLKQAA